jgi:hypothetical protein
LFRQSAMTPTIIAVPLPRQSPQLACMRLPRRHEDRG